MAHAHYEDSKQTPPRASVSIAQRRGRASVGRLPLAEVRLPVNYTVDTTSTPNPTLYLERVLPSARVHAETPIVSTHYPGVRSKGGVYPRVQVQRDTDPWAVGGIVLEDVHLPARLLEQDNK